MKIRLILLVSLCATGFISAQNNVGIGTTTPNPSAILDLSSTTKGILFPRMSSTQRINIPTPAPGLMVFQNNGTSSLGLWYFDGTSWQRTAKASELSGSSSWLLTGNNQYSNVSGNVGIGITSGISEKLFLNGDMFINAPGGPLGNQLNSAELKLRGSNLGSSIISFLKPDTTQGASIYFSSLGNNLSLGHSSSNRKMRFYNSGKIQIGSGGGIWPDTAVSVLHIKDGDFANLTSRHGYLMLGTIGSENLALGNYEILARNNGQTSPLYLQQEGGAVRIGKTGITANTRLHITDGNESSLTTDGYFLMGTTNGSNMVMDVNEIQARYNGAATTLRLQQDGGSLLVQGGALTVASNGYVGIGDLTPDAPLHVAGDGLFNGTNPTIQLQNSGVDKGFVQLSTDNLRVGTNSSNTNGSFVVRTAGVDRFFVNSAGNVGIGMATPLSRLHVAGHTRMTGNGELLRLDGVSPNIGFYSSGTYRGFISQGSTDLFIGVNGGKLQLDATQIAIGSVQSTADNFKLAVSGKIICEELKVELVGTWPDYVFDEQYSLRPLNELKEFISENNHLPNIPSAAEVADKGIEVGAMNKLLLEKVEELTLYILRQQEQIDALGNLIKENKQ